MGRGGEGWGGVGRGGVWWGGVGCGGEGWGVVGRGGVWWGGEKWGGVAVPGLSGCAGSGRQERSPPGLGHTSQGQSHA